MKFSKYWLQEILGFDICTKQLIEQLSSIGLDVTSLHKNLHNFNKVIVGEIINIDQHPFADKLKICTVNIGDDKAYLNIICGATNVKQGLKVAIAVLGAMLPNNIKIKKVKLRGIESNGMICSAHELGLSYNNYNGILELSQDAPIGHDVFTYLNLDDEIIDVEVMGNRGDHLGIIGIAREISAINDKKFNLPKIKDNQNNSESKFKIIIDSLKECPFYNYRIINNINININIPDLIKTRLDAIGFEINNSIIDIINYVMIETGIPLFCFDLDKLKTKIKLRYAIPNEEIFLINNKKISLDEKTLVLSDEEEIIAMSGLIYGKKGYISSSTKNLFLECAFYKPEYISIQSRKYDIQSDSSFRYERGIDFSLQKYALKLATSLITKITKGNSTITYSKSSNYFFLNKKSISLSENYVNTMLGIKIEFNKINKIFDNLNFLYKSIDAGWNIIVPSWRLFDIKEREDIIEDIARFYGYNAIKEIPIRSTLLCENHIDYFDQTKKINLDLNRIRMLMEDLGYHELIMYSFVNKDLQRNFFIEDKLVLHLMNPISSEYTVMRSTLWPGLITALLYNIERQVKRVRFFEIGKKFLLSQNNQIEQKETLSGIAFGELYPLQWGLNGKLVDFYDLKNDLKSLFKLMNYNSKVDYTPISQTEIIGLHPKNSANILINNIVVGCIGEIHPFLKNKLNLNSSPIMFEIDLSSLPNYPEFKLKQICKFPKITRDISIVIDNDVSYEILKQKIIDTAGDVLHHIDIFDIYNDINLNKNQISISFRLVFQSFVRTLIDLEINALVDEIILVLKYEFNAKLRG